MFEIDAMGFQPQRRRDWGWGCAGDIYYFWGEGWWDGELSGGRNTSRMISTMKTIKGSMGRIDPNMLAVNTLPPSIYLPGSVQHRAFPKNKPSSPSFPLLFNEI